MVINLLCSRLIINYELSILANQLDNSTVHIMYVIVQLNYKGQPIGQEHKWIVSHIFAICCASSFFLEIYNIIKINVINTSFYGSVVYIHSGKISSDLSGLWRFYKYILKRFWKTDKSLFTKTKNIASKVLFNQWIY